jgi:hypothetical protein
MASDKEDAETLRLGLLTGFASIAEVVGWADTVIMRQPSPDPAIVNVALGGSRSLADMVALLSEIPGEADPIPVLKRLRGRFLSALERDQGEGARIARWLYQLAAHGEIPEEPFGWEPYGFDDMFELARQGVYGTSEIAVAELRRYLEQHSERTAA